MQPQASRCPCGYIHGPDCPLAGGWDFKAVRHGK